MFSCKIRTFFLLNRNIVFSYRLGFYLVGSATLPRLWNSDLPVSGWARISAGLCNSSSQYGIRFQILKFVSCVLPLQTQPWRCPGRAWTKRRQRARTIIHDFTSEAEKICYGYLFFYNADKILCFYRVNFESNYLLNLWNWKTHYLNFNTER